MQQANKYGNPHIKKSTEILNATSRVLLFATYCEGGSLLTIKNVANKSITRAQREGS